MRTSDLQFRRVPPAALLALALLAVPGLPGCGSTEASRFYVLAPLAGAPEAPTPADAPRLGVERVAIPPLVDRPQMVESLSLHERRFDEFARWGEPLEDNITRVVAQNLAALLAPGLAVAETARELPGAGPSLALTILRFDAEADGSCVVQAACLLRGPGGSRAVPLPAEFRAQAAEDVPQARAAALSACLLDLSRALAAALAPPAAP
jgi:uncharacterized protein